MEKKEHRKRTLALREGLRRLSRALVYQKELDIVAFDTEGYLNHVEEENEEDIILFL